MLFVCCVLMEDLVECGILLLVLVLAVASDRSIADIAVAAKTGAEAGVNFVRAEDSYVTWILGSKAIKFPLDTFAPCIKLYAPVTAEVHHSKPEPYQPQSTLATFPADCYIFAYFKHPMTIVEVETVATLAVDQLDCRTPGDQFIDWV